MSPVKVNDKQRYGVPVRDSEDITEEMGGGGGGPMCPSSAATALNALHSGKYKQGPSMRFVNVSDCGSCPGVNGLTLI